MARGSASLMTNVGAWQPRVPLEIGEVLYGCSGRWPGWEYVGVPPTSIGTSAQSVSREFAVIPGAERLVLQLVWSCTWARAYRRLDLWLREGARSSTKGWRRPRGC